MQQILKARTWSRPSTLVMTTAPYSVYVNTPTKANVVCDEKIRSPQPCVVCIRPSRQIMSGIGISKSTLQHKVGSTHDVHILLCWLQHAPAGRQSKTVPCVADACLQHPVASLEFCKHCPMISATWQIQQTTTLCITTAPDSTHCFSAALECWQQLYQHAYLEGFWQRQQYATAVTRVVHHLSAEINNKVAPPM